MMLYFVFTFGVLFGVCLVLFCAAIVSRRAQAFQRRQKAELDAEILSRWIQLDVIRRHAEERGYEFVDKRAKA